MSPRPLIFISAVSQELRSARQLVANTLTFLGYQPIWQEIFATEGGDLCELLRRQINQCKGVVQLVGRCYGIEPSAPDPKFGRVSYTQYEALYAREAGKKVWYLFIDEHFPADPHEAEPEELRALQASYRRTLQTDTHLFHPLATREALEASVLRLRDELGRLRRRVTQWAVGVVSLLTLILGLVIWVVVIERTRSAQLEELKLAINRIPQAELEARRPRPNASPDDEKQAAAQEQAVLREHAYEVIANELKVDPTTLRERVIAAAPQLQRARDVSTFLRANAAYVDNDYIEAERLALEAADEARLAGPSQSTEVIRALTLAGLSAQNAIQYSRASNHFREAEKLIDVTRDAEQWATLQNAIASLLSAQGKFSDAEALFHKVIEVRTRVLGPENRETLTSRDRLIYALNEEEKHVEAEAEAREVVALREKILGSEHPDTLVSRYALANALSHGGKSAEAEPIYRQLIELTRKVLGPENTRTLAAQIGLANLLNNEGRIFEAEAIYREVVEADKKVYGPDHPVTLNDRMNLATALQAAGKYQAAEAEYKSVIAAQEKLIGPEHADTLNTRNNFAELLDDEGKFDEAETECRRIIPLEEKVAGPEARLTLNTRANLAVALIGQGRINEALPDCLEVLQLMERKFGPNYIDTRDFTLKFANQLVRQHRVAEAIQLVTDARLRARQSLGPDHPLIQTYAKVIEQLRRGNQ